MRSQLFAGGLAAAALAQLVATPVARACGCFSPPAVTVGDFAVNQSGELILFEVEPGWVTAHVLIRYAGNPSQFAWIVPVPEVPTLSLSPASAFGLLDASTAPQVTITENDICPTTSWTCHYDDNSGGGCMMAAAKSNHAYPSVFDAGVSTSDAPGAPSPVQIIQEQTIGDYQTVTFTASNAQGAVQWLQQNGFVVNNTTSIYMESYIQQNMVFVAAKLVPGAGVQAIKPLKMRYRANYPSVPLILSAVAAQPHLTVTSFIYSSTAFRPQGHPIVSVPRAQLAADPAGRVNYPMVLARTIDEAGGAAFAVEYSGDSSPFQITNKPCCSGTNDYCGIANDGQCECPGTTIDAADCANTPDLVQGVQLLQQLGTTYPYLTRITTRLSPEQMTFDPTYEPDFQGSGTGNQRLYANNSTLNACKSSVVDQARFAILTTLQGCSTTYCGLGSRCVTTAQGAACACAAGTVAQRFTDLDGKPSVTCVPATPPVDLRAGGATLPDSCASQTCGAGTCADRNGIPVCTCNAGAAAAIGGTDAKAPLCALIEMPTTSPGAEDFSTRLTDLDVCAPALPACGDGGKYEYIGSSRPGVDCGNATPPPALRWSNDAGCCQQTRHTPPIGFALGALVVLGLLLRRRRLA